MAFLGFQYEPVSLDVNHVCFENQDIPKNQGCWDGLRYIPGKQLLGLIKDIEVDLFFLMI